MAKIKITIEDDEGNVISAGSARSGQWCRSSAPVARPCPPSRPAARARCR